MIYRLSSVRFINLPLKHFRFYQESHSWKEKPLTLPSIFGNSKQNLTCTHHRVGSNVDRISKIELFKVLQIIFRCNIFTNVEEIVFHVSSIEKQEAIELFCLIWKKSLMKYEHLK